MAPKNTFLSLFGNSPISPLQKHMGEVQSCVVELVPFFKAVFKGQWDKAEEVQKRIAELEGEADQMKHELRLKLPAGMMLAMDRRDLLEVLSTQDKIANKAKDIAGLVLGRQMSFPDNMHEPLMNFVKRCIAASDQAQRAINELDELLESGFRGREIELVESMVNNLDSIESDTDTMQVEVRALLFAVERELPPIDVMFLYRVIEWIGDVADLAQRVGSRLELMLAR